MPSFEHEALLQLFRGDPSLAAEVLRSSFDIHLPDGEARPIEANFAEILPMARLADLVIAIGDARIIVEVQLSRDDEKRWAWPHYAMALRARDRCRVLLLVVTNSDEVAAWARSPIELGPPGAWFAPLVIGPGFLTISDAETARRFPELAVLSVVLRQGTKPDLEAVHAALTAVQGLAPDQEKLYIDFILRSLGDEAQHVLEALMSISPGKYEYQSEFARKFFGQGREKGREEGREEGRLKTMGHAIVSILSERGLDLSEEQRATILSASDLSVLDRWLRLSVTVPTVDEMFSRSRQIDD